MSKKKIMLGLLIFFAIFPLLIVDNADVSARSRRYMLVVNVNRSVVTAYKWEKGRWRPHRAMIASAGSFAKPTPLGNFSVKTKHRWHHLIEDVKGQYCTKILPRIYFHSVYYPKNKGKNSISYEAYRQLGRRASHGCVRLTVMDAKWINDNVARGSRVKIVLNGKLPLGKPKRLSVRGRYGWDPTDPDPGNPNFRIRKPVLRFAGKRSEYTEGDRVFPMRHVKAEDPNTFQDLTYRVRIIRKEKWYKGRYVLFNGRINRKRGLYKLHYKVRDPYSGTTVRTFRFKILSKYRKDRPVFKLSREYYKYKKIAKNKYAMVRTVDTRTRNAYRGINVVLNRHRYNNITSHTKARLYYWNEKKSKYVLSRTFNNSVRAGAHRFRYKGLYKLELRVKNPYANKRARAVFKRVRIIVE